MAGKGSKWLALGRCSHCGGKEPLIPGTTYGEICKARKRQQDRCRSHCRSPRNLSIELEPPPREVVSIWSVNLVAELEALLERVEFDLRVTA